jgi:ATP-binding cassette subfamily B protein
LTELSLRRIIFFYALIGYFTSPVASLIGMNKTAQNFDCCRQTFFEIMDLEREETENKSRIARENIGDIKFENVSFRYGSRTEVLKFQRRFQKNETTAIVGRKRSGKTTLIALLQNLYPIKEGRFMGNMTLNLFIIKVYVIALG